MPNPSNTDSPAVGSTPSIVLDKTCEDGWTLRVGGEVGLESAGQLKTLLLESLASPKGFELDLSDVCVWDVTLMQLVLATERESPAGKGRIVSKVSAQANEMAQSAGFARFPGLPNQDGVD